MNAGLVIPTCLPGEFFTGALGRCALLNGASANEVFRILLGQPAQWRSPAIIEPLAAIFGLSCDELIGRHSPMPFLGRFDGPEHAQQSRRLKFAANSLVQPFHRFRFCPDCVAEDRAQRGFAIWRTVHQLPGMTWCLTHEHILTETQWSPRNGCPDHAPEFGSTCDRNRTGVDDRPAPMALRLMRLCQTLITMPPGPSARVVVRRLRRRANELDIRVRSGAPSSRLSLGAYAQQRLDSDAVADLLGRINNRDKCPWASLDGALTANSNAAIKLCVMACILFEDTESTLECLAGPVTSEESPHASPHGSHNDSATHDSVMQRTYYRARGSYRTAALFLGRSDGAVSAALKRRGLPNFTQATARSTVRALASFGDGASLSEACITHGANVHEVEKFLRFGGSAIFECARRIRQDHESDADGSAVTAARRA